MSCLDCPNHEIINDPDPDYWFCDDDMAVICKLTPNDKKDPSSKWVSDRNDFKSSARSCRPHYLRKESTIPDWCPKKK